MKTEKGVLMIGRPKLPASCRKTDVIKVTLPPATGRKFRSLARRNKRKPAVLAFAVLLEWMDRQKGA